jgi:hypothetical protein
MGFHVISLLKRSVWLKLLYIQKSDELFLETVWVLSLVENLFLQKKSFTRFSLQSECSNFNQWEHWIYNRSFEEDLEEEMHYFAAKNRWEGWAHLVLP